MTEETFIKLFPFFMGVLVCQNMTINQNALIRQIIFVVINNEISQTILPPAVEMLK